MQGRTSQFDVVMMVDYSAKQTRGRARGEVNGIWLSTGRGRAAAAVQPFRTRIELAAYLADALDAALGAGDRVLLGLDFGFGYPVGTAAALDGSAGVTPGGLSPWAWMWSELGRSITDEPSAANNRFAVAGEFNRRTDADGPFWGRPATADVPGLPMMKPDYPHVVRSSAEELGLGEWRLTEVQMRRSGAVPKSMWQLAGAGSVGGQSLVGIAMLDRLRRGVHAAAVTAGRLAVWPFEDHSAAQVVLAEVYPSLVPVAGPQTMVHDARQVLGLVEWFRQSDRSGALYRLLEGPRSGPPPIREEEGWVLGVPV